MTWQVYSAFGLALSVAFVLILQSWRRGIYFVFGWLLLEDVVRRLLPGQPASIQLVKEVLLLWTYIAFFVTRKTQGRLLWSPPFILSFLAFSGVVVVDAFNPEIPGLFVPVAGIRSYLWYVPLLWIGYYGFKSKLEMARFCRRLVFTAVPLAALGVIQYFLWDQLPPWLLPLEGAHSIHAAAFEYQGEIISFESKLPSSVFGSSFRFANFGLFLFFLGLGISGWKVSYSKIRGKRFLRVCVLASLVCIVVAGTRMAMLLTVLGLLLLVVEPVLTGRGGLLMKRAWLRQILASLILCAAFLGVLQVFSDSGKFFLYTTGGDVESHWEQFTRGQLPLVLKKAAWLGFGTGALSQGVTHIQGGDEAFELASRESEGVGVEYGLAKVTWELGVLGLVVFLFLWGHIFLSIARYLRALRGLQVRPLAAPLAAYLLLLFVAFLKGHQYFGDGTTLVLYWFGMGMFFSLRRLQALGGSTFVKPSFQAQPQAVAVPVR